MELWDLARIRAPSRSPARGLGSGTGVLPSIQVLLGLPGASAHVAGQGRVDARMVGVVAGAGDFNKIVVSALQLPASGGELLPCGSDVFGGHCCG